jgi:lauroyl/myristoyl acyltransferase
MSNFRLTLGEIRDYIIYLIYRAVGWLLGCLPLSWVFRLGQAVGWLGYNFLGGYRRLAWANIQIAFPDWTGEEVQRCAKRHFKELVANLLCSFVLLEKPWDEVRKHLDVSNFERATERINGAESVIWTINHIGNWELFVFCAKLVRPGKHGVIYRALPMDFRKVCTY